MRMAHAGVLVNLVFMALNLLPMPPLDGGRIVVGLLPHKLAYAYSRIEPYGFFILIGLLATNTLTSVLVPFWRARRRHRRLFVLSAPDACSPIAFFPACARRARCTLATITAR